MFEYEETREFRKTVSRLDWIRLCLYDKSYEEGRRVLREELKVSEKKRELLWQICRYKYEMLKNRVYGYYLAKTDGRCHWLAPDDFDGGIQEAVISVLLMFLRHLKLDTLYCRSARDV